MRPCFWANADCGKSSAAPWWMMVSPSATAHLNSPVIILAVRACGEESTLMNPIPAELTGLPRFSSLMLLEASFYPPLSFLPYHSSFFFFSPHLFLISYLFNSHLPHSSCCPDMSSPLNFNSLHLFILSFSLAVIRLSLRDRKPWPLPKLT